ncbi:MAG TPA: hypothetical protein VE912_22300 [Bacteroidales bacterium]|nr:hypothetical protein [Bacteroidales bacterium]
MLRLKWLRNKEIDYNRWDKCIQHSFNGSVFAFSWFLDIVSPDWGALVDEEYESVMPLPGRRFINYPVIRQPSWAASLGIYSVGLLKSGTIEAFIKSIPADYSTVNLYLNKYNRLNGSEAYLKRWKKSYELDLINDYQKIRSRYSSNTIAKLEQSEKAKLTIVRGLQPNEIINLYNRSNIKRPVLKKEKEASLRMIISSAIRFKMGELYGIYSANNTLCAAGFFIWSHNKVYLLFRALNYTGSQSKAQYFLIDQFIRQHAGKNTVLNLEYMKTRNEEHMCLGFGAKECLYPEIKINTLPWYIKVFHR